MDNEMIKAAVLAADSFTKGAADAPALRSVDYEDAMFALAEARR